MASNEVPIRPAEATSNQLHDEAELGYSSQLVMKASEPVIERRLMQLLDQFAVCPPELGPLLDLRAQISEVWRFRKELKKNVSKGESAMRVISRVLNADGVSSGNRTAKTG